MTILQIHKYYWHRDGASNYMLFLSDLLEAAGNTVVPFSMKQPQTLDSQYAKYFVSDMDLAHPENIGVLKKIQSAGRMIYSVQAKKQMQLLIDDIGHVDVAHLHNIYHHISPSILPVLKKAGASIVMTLHDYKLISPNYSLFHHGEIHEENATGWYISCLGQKCMKDSYTQSAVVTAEMIWHHKIMRYYERYIDKFITPSQYVMDICIRHGWSKEKFVHIPNPIDMRGFSLQEHDDGYVAYVGRLSEEKGVNVLLEAIKQTPDIQYRIVGDGPKRAEFESYVKKEQMTNVHFDGFLSGDKLKVAIANARVLVVPSIWYENYPYSVLEPMAMGKIVIGSNIGGIPEQLPEALLFPPHDAVALAKCIKRWYNTSLSDRLQMGHKLRERVEKTNDPEKHVQAIEKLYQEVMKVKR